MSSLTNPAYIRPILEKNGFRFSKAMGQNFLIDSSVPERIAESVGADRECSVLEIGPGIGCLTSALAERYRRVVAVEIDRGLITYDEESAGEENGEA